MINLNPFIDSAYCKFLFVGKWNVKNHFHVPLHECCLEHGHNCTVTGGKVKLTMLLRDPGFVTTLQAHGGKATEHVMRAEAAKLGFGGDAATPDVFWRANASLRSIDNHLWDAKWRTLSSYLVQLREGSSCYTHWKTTADNTFKYYFVAFYSVRDVLQTNGRPVCSTDMGHFKHQLFEGMNVTGANVVYCYCCFVMHCFFVGCCLLLLKE